MRMLGTSNGVSTHPMPQLDVEGMLRSGAKVERMGGAALRWRQAPPCSGVETGLEPVRCGGVVEAVAHIVLARPHHLDAVPPSSLDRKRRLDGEVALGLAAEAAAQQRRLQGDLGGETPSAAAMSSRAWPGLCTGAQISHLPWLMRATAAGGSMVAWWMCGA